ncbi:MAG: DUF4403 family protein [Bacteroidetes bacterium]|nr:DUF4403 family protein [Bacteroidota bacterium]
MQCFRKLPVLLIFLLLGSCSTLKIERPPESYQEIKYTPPVSYLSIPFEIDLKKMERLVNQQFKGLIYADTSFEDNDNDNLMLKAWKMADIKLAMSGNQLFYQVPLTVWVKKKFVIGALGFAVSQAQEVSGNVILKFRTRIAVNKDWSISSTTFSDGYEWVTTPSLQIGGISIPLPVISDLLLSANQNIINSQIDRAFRSSIDLRSYFEKIWKDIQEPIKISDEYALWAKITPLEISTVPLQGTSNQITHTVGLKAWTELSFGDKPEYRINENLPDLKITSRLENNISVSLSLDIPLPRLIDVARQQLVGYTYRQGKYTVEVKDIFLFGSGDKLVMALNVTGSIKGTIYLAGKPAYNRETSTIGVKELQFDIRTSNVLVRSASWLFHHNLVETLEQKLSFPVGDQLLSAQSQLQSYLDANKKMEYFRVSGNIEKPEIGTIFITRESIKAEIVFRGEINVKLEE